MTRSPLSMIGALAVALALLSATGTLTAQAPPPEYIPGEGDILQFKGAIFECYQITPAAQEASHEKPSPKTPIFISPSPTEAENPSHEITPLAPPAQATPTLTLPDATPTPEITPPAPPVATRQPKPTQTPTMYPTAATTPLMTCAVAVRAGVNVRDEPGEYGAIVGALGYDYRVEPVRVGGGGRWYRIEKPLPGWVAAWLVDCEG